MARIVFKSGSHEIPIAHIYTLQWEQRPGHSGAPLYVPFHDDYKAAYDAMVADVSGDSGPVDGVRGSFEFTVEDTGEEQVVEWAGWIALSVVKHEAIDDIWVMTVTDIRELLTYGKIDAVLNTFWEDGREMPSSSRPTVGGATEAAIFALQESMGLPIGTIPLATPLVQNTDRMMASDPWPKNIGNTENHYGGWIGKTWAEFCGLLAKNHNLYPFVTMDGEIALTANQGVRSDIEALIPDAVVDSYISESNNTPARPRKIVLHFEKVKEFALESVPLTVTPPEHGVYIEPVLRITDDFEGVRADERWTTIAEFFSLIRQQVPHARVGPGDGNPFIARRYFQDPIIQGGIDPVDRLPLADFGALEYAQSSIRQNWRKKWRVFNRLEHLQLANITMGRIPGDDEDTPPAAVMCDYTYVRSRDRVDETTDERMPMLARLVWSETVLWDSLGGFLSWFRSGSMAPFRAVWEDSTEQVIGLHLTGNLNRHTVADVVPGRLLEPFGFGEFFEAEIDGDLSTEVPQIQLARLLPRGRFDPEVKMRIIAHGNPTSLTERIHEEERPLFADGCIEALVVKIWGLTAEYTFDWDGGAIYTSSIDAAQLPADVVRNQSDIDDVCDRVVDEIERSYERDRLGAVSMGGLSSLMGAPVEVGGECNLMWIELGKDDKHFVLRVNYSISPGQIEVDVSRKEQDGSPVRVTLG
jgi:hypothetical protein